MKKCSLSLILVIFAFAVNAQEFKKSFTLYYATDSDQLTQESQVKLDSIIQLSQKAGAYSLQLSAHTDQAGSNTYNEALAKRRENSATTYLGEAGLDFTKMSSLSQGERNPIVKLADGQENPLNRRVEILLTYHLFRNGIDVLESQRKQTQQKFELKSSGINEIKGSQGTTLLIPSNAFMREDGSFVDNKEVSFVLEEFPSMGDAILNGLATSTHDGQLLETGGMLFIEAKAKGETLKLREGMKIDVQMPSRNLQEGMTVFTGRKDANGIIQWENTASEFKKTNTIQRIKIPLDGMAEELLSWRVPLEVNNNSIQLAAIELKIPKRPNMPHLPRFPKEPVKPEAPEGEKPVITWFNAEWKAYQGKLSKYEEELVKYPTRYASYEKRLEKYHEQMKGFHDDSARYTEQVEVFDAHLRKMIDDREKILNESARLSGKYAWNSALSSIAAKCKDSVYSSSYITRELNQTSSFILSNNLISSNKSLIEQLGMLRNLQEISVEDLYTYASVRGVYNQYKFRRSVYKNKIQNKAKYHESAYYSNKNEFAASKMAEAHISERLIEMEERILSMKQKLGFIDRQDINTVYSASLSGLGFINCDRFSNIPPARMARIEIEGAGREDQVMACVHRINSVLTFYTDEKGVRYANIPKGEKITVVAISAKDGIAKMDMTKMKVGLSDSKVEMKPMPVDLKVMRATLSKL